MSKSYTLEQIYVKVAKYCAYQERSLQEVRQKLTSFGIYADQAEEVIQQLIDENFLNENRFAELFTRGKFYQKKWGKIKIKYALQQKGISSKLIQDALNQIDPDNYLDTLTSLLEKKYQSLKNKQDLRWKTKLAQFVISKGFEPELVWSKIRELFK